MKRLSPVAAKLTRLGDGMDIKASHGFFHGTSGSVGAALVFPSTNEAMKKGDTVFVAKPQHQGPYLLFGSDGF